MPSSPGSARRGGHKSSALRPRLGVAAALSAALLAWAADATWVAPTAGRTLVAAGRPAAPNPAGLVPANWQQVNDNLGFRWDINQGGMINDGQNDCFDGGFYLVIQNQQFNGGGQAMMTPDGSEYVLTQMMPTPAGQVEVTRRVKIDRALSAVRYVESFRNPGAAAMSVPVQVRTTVGGQFQTMVTDTGAPNATALGKKDSGVLLYQMPGQGRPSVAMLLAAPSSKLKPVITNQNNRQLTVAYNLTVPPGKTVSVVHVAGQRNVAAIPDAKSLKALYDPWRSPKFLRDLPADVRKSIANWGGASGGSGWSMGGDEDSNVPSLESLLGVAPGSADVLAVGEGTRLRGTTAWDELSVQTRFASRVIPLAEVAALSGPRSPGGQTRIFLRDGQVLRGTFRIKGLRFTLDSGVAVDLAPETLDRLVLAAGPGDGKPDPDVYAYLETQGGDRVALRGEGDAALAAATPWGLMDLPLKEVVRLKAAEGQPGYTVRLRDGTYVFAYVADADLPLATKSFGPQKVPLPEVRSIWAADAKPAEEASPAAVGLSAGPAGVANPAAAMVAFTGSGRISAVSATPPGSSPFPGAPAGPAAPTSGRRPVPSAAPEDKIEGPYLALAGGYRLVGPIEATELHFVVAGQAIPLAPTQVRSLQRGDDSSGAADAEGEGEDANPTFTAELWTGGTLVGPLREPVIPIRAGGRVCRVPLADVLEMSMPLPAAPDAVRDRTALLIRDLGAPEWEKREAATRGLIDIGPLAKVSLEDAMRTASDPEVKRRLQTAMDGIDK